MLANHERAERRRGRLGDRLADEVGTAVHAATEQPTGAISSAFARLRSTDRELLALVAWEGLDARELALVVGCSRNAARIRLHRARRRFAQALEQEDERVKRERPAGHVSLTAIRTED